MLIYSFNLYRIFYFFTLLYSIGVIVITPIYIFLIFTLKNIKNVTQSRCQNL